MGAGGGGEREEGGEEGGGDVEEAHWEVSSEGLGVGVGVDVVVEERLRWERGQKQEEKYERKPH